MIYKLFSDGLKLGLNELVSKGGYLPIAKHLYARNNIPDANIYSRLNRITQLEQIPDDESEANERILTILSEYGIYPSPQ